MSSEGGGADLDSAIWRQMHLVYVIFENNKSTLPNFETT